MAIFKRPIIITGMKIRQRHRPEDMAKFIQLEADSDYLATYQLTKMTTYAWNILRFPYPIAVSTVRINILLANQSNKPGNVGFRDIVFEGCLQ